jgi:hypothetical protein
MPDRFGVDGLSYKFTLNEINIFGKEVSMVGGGSSLRLRDPFT